MTTTQKVIALSGSIRNGSFNTSILQIAAKAVESKGIEVTLINLSDYELPFYNADLEAASGMPQKASQLKELFKQHTGLLIASPEYNSSYSALLKNTIDWISRPSSDSEEPLIAFKGKIAGILSASPGRFGGKRGLLALRTLLANIQVDVIEQEAGVANAHEVIDTDGSLSEPKALSEIQSVGYSLAEKLTRQVNLV